MWKTVFKISLILILASTGPSIQQKYEDAKLDIVLLIDRSSSIQPNDYNKMLDVVATSPKTFPIGPTKTQLAIIVFDYFADIKMQLNGDGELFQRTLVEMKKDGVQGFTATNEALKMAREHVFAYDQRRDVTDIVIILTDGCTNPKKAQEKEELRKIARNETEYEAKLLRDGDAIIFLVYFGDEHCPVDHQIKIVGDENNRFALDNFNDLKETIFAKMRDIVAADMCKWRTLCYYDDDEKESCVADWWRKPAYKTYDCTESKPLNTPIFDCDCEEHCHRYFKATDPHCKSSCSDESSNVCSGCIRCFAEKKTPRPTSKKSKASTRSSETAPVNPPAVVEPNSGKDGGSSTWNMLYIAIGVGALLLILLLLVLAVVVVVRKRRRRDQQIELMKKKAMAEGQANMVAPGVSRSKSRGSKSKKSEWEKNSGYQTMDGSKSGPSIQLQSTGVHGTGRRSASTPSIIGAGIPIVPPAHRLRTPSRTRTGVGELVGPTERVLPGRMAATGVSLGSGYQSGGEKPKRESQPPSKNRQESHSVSKAKMKSAQRPDRKPSNLETARHQEKPRRSRAIGHSKMRSKTVVPRK